MSLRELLRVVTEARLLPHPAGVFEMVRRLRLLEERHSLEQAPHLVRAHLCGACHKPWPCPDAEILNGREP